MTLAKRQSFLRTLYIFEDWPDSLLLNLARRCKERRLKPGEQMAAIGSFIKEVFFIQSGETKLLLPKDHKTPLDMNLATRGVGDILGGHGT